MRITQEMSEGAYPIAKQVYSERLSRIEGKYEINKRTGMTLGSAQDFIMIFLSMMEGKVYKRAFNNPTNRFLLESIREDYGEAAFLRALDAAQQHIHYYDNSTSSGKLIGYQKIVDELRGTARPDTMAT